MPSRRATVGAGSTWDDARSRPGPHPAYKELPMDEPPIRVKGGSIEMDVIHDTKQWRKHNNSNRKWNLSSGTRDSNKYLVYVGTTAGNCTKCTSSVHVGGVVVFHHNDGTKVTIKSEQKHTFVTSTADLDTPTVGNRKLEYTGAGYISSIEIDGNTVCTFTNSNQLHSVLLTEEP